jgi:uncharacterized membrane protein YccC
VKKHPLKSKTVWFGVIVAMLSVLQGFVFDLPLKPALQALIGCIIAAAIVILRFMTEGSIRGEED